MLIQPAKPSANLVGLRIGGAIAGTLVLLLALIALIRPEMGMAMLHSVMSAAGF
jgi:hypothetical protein